MIRKPKKNELILIAVLIASIMWVASLDSKVKRTRAKNHAARQTASAQNPVQVIPLAVDRQVKRRNAISKAELSPYWGADPFDRMFTRNVAREVAVDAAAPAPPPAHRLFGVMLGARGPTALIDSGIYGVGDTLSAYRVVSIAKNRVVLRHVRNRKRLELRMD